MNGSRFHFHHRPRGRPGRVGRIAALEHHAFDRIGVGGDAGCCRVGARRDQLLPGGEGDERRQIDAGIVEAPNQRFQPRAALGERPLAHVFGSVDQEVVGAQVRRIVGEQLGADGLPVEPLLQQVERCDAAVALHQELPVERAGERERGDEIGEARRNVLAGTRIEPGDAAAVGALAGDRLHTDAVPLVFRHEGGRIERAELVLLDGMRQHHRAEWRRIARFRPRLTPFDPGEQLDIGRLEAGPDQLDLVRILVAECRHRGLRQPRRHADAQRAGDELEQSPAAGLVEQIEPVSEPPRQLGLAERCKRGDDFGERGGGLGGLLRQRPHQRDGLGQVADVVVGQAEQHRIGALGDQPVDQARLGVAERQGADERRQRPTPFGVGHGAEMLGHQAELGVTSVLEGEAIEQRSKPIHGSASAGTASCSSSP